MKKTLLIFGIALTIFVFPGVVTAEMVLVTPNLPPKDYKGAVAEQPAYTAGQYWMFEFPPLNNVVAKWEYVGEKDNFLVLHSGNNKYVRHLSKGLTTVKVFERSTGMVVYELKGQIQDLQFPLWVGKSWMYTEKKMGDSDYLDYEFRYAVIEYIPVTVQAGTYLAFRVLRTCRKKERIGITECAPDENYWYAPTTNMVIKLTTGEKTTSRELVSTIVGIPAGAPSDPRALLGKWQGEIHLQGDAVSAQLRADGQERTLVISNVTLVDGKKTWDVAAQYGIGTRLAPVRVEPEIGEGVRFQFVTGAGARVQLLLSDDQNLSGTFVPKGSNTYYFMRFKKVE